ncbi:MAG: 1-acyl-sn-glycerol-3-phosphate acyltransferase, partial [Bdellovibrionales bacterium]|nr:1-acyl-sn-glycerol-3-phosphate acyltransferase [Bdellovibrionales bacterium]
VVFCGAFAVLPQLDSPTAHRLGRHFKLEFYRNLKMVRGTPFQPFHVQRRIVLSGHEYEREIKAIANRTGISVREAHRRAVKLFNRMAAKPFAPFYVPAAVVVRFILKRLFSGLTVRGLEKFASSVKHHTVVLVPMHRSHLDYLLLGAILYEANLNSAVVAAGVNLSFWPFGNIIRGLGGYFVKRNARHDRIHALVLKRYVTYLVKRGHLQEFFIEGGRSRSGRMRPPRLGLLSIMVSAYLRGERKDILFVPVSISYEHVIEDSEYGKENTGLSKTKENLSSLLRARSIFRNNYKEVIIQFGSPMSLSHFRSNLRKEDRRRGPMVNKLGLSITRDIELQSSVGLRTLTYTALLLSPRYGLPKQKLEESIHSLARLASLFHEIHPNHDGGEFTPSLKRYLEEKDTHTVDVSASSGLATQSFLGEEIVYIPGAQRFTADFYKNSTLHVFFPVGLLSLLQLQGEPLTAEGCLPFYEIFKHDYLLGEEEKFLLEMRRMIALLEGENILKRSDGNLSFADEDNGLFLPALLESPIQSLLWIYYNLQTFPASETQLNDPSETQVKRALHYQSFLQCLQEDFSASKYFGMLSRTEASSLISLTSTLSSLRARNIIQFIERGGKPMEILVLEEMKEEVALLEKINTLIHHWLITHSLVPSLTERDTPDRQEHASAS